MIRLRYGDGQELRIDLPAEAMVADFSGPRGRSLADPAAAVAAALADPLDYPALQRAVTPGDRVVLAIDRGVPQLDAVVAGAVHSLLGGSVSPEDITLLLAPQGNGGVERNVTAALAPDIAAAVRVVEHDPQNSREMSYLAASKENRPIYIHRQLFDADLVLPIGCLRPRYALARLGVHGGIVPDVLGCQDARAISDGGFGAGVRPEEAAAGGSGRGGLAAGDSDRPATGAGQRRFASCTSWPATPSPSPNAAGDCAMRLGCAECPGGPAWSSPPLREAAKSRPGRISRAPCRPPWPPWPTTASSCCARICAARPARRCSCWPA